MTRKPPYRTDRGRKWATALPIACWNCWWKECGRCFNAELGTVPKAHISPITGEESETLYNVGWEITDEHWFLCLDNFEQKKQDKLIEGAEGNARRLLLMEAS